jgi:hypothetical protein
MAHYAFLDPATNVVLEVIVGRDEGEGTDFEAYYSNVRGLPCKRTSYNTRNGVHLYGGTPYRGTYAGLGFTVDPTRGPDGEFVPPQEQV